MRDGVIISKALEHHSIGEIFLDLRGYFSDGVIYDLSGVVVIIN